MEILYNKRNIESESSPSFHAVLVYSNVNNERYNFDEDDFNANFYLYLRGELMFESAMVEIEPRMAHVFVSPLGDAFLVLQCTTGEIRYVRVRANGGNNTNDKAPLPAAIMDQGGDCCDVGKLTEINMHLRKSMKVFMPSVSCRGSWYWSDDREVQDQISSTTPPRCNCHECNVELGIHSSNEATTIFDSMKFLALLNYASFSKVSNNL